MHKEVELRKLPAALLFSLTNILEKDEDWKKVMAVIPKNPLDMNSELKYNSEHIRMIEDYATSSSRRCTEIMFDEWGTSGRVRPTLATLTEVVLKAQIYRAADEIASILKEAAPARPTDGPAASIDTNITMMLNDESMEIRLNTMESIKTGNFHSTTMNGTNLDTLCNGTTKQMKSASDLIQFSKSDNNIPNISGLQSFDKRTTARIDSQEVSDLMKFSKSTINSEYLPDFDVLIPKSGVAVDNSSRVSSITMSTESETDSSQVMPTPIKQTNQLPHPYVPEVYQMSLPNIDLFNEVDSVILEDTNLIQFEYRELEAITSRFANELVNSPRGPTGKIGSGGFGEVFVGTHSSYGPLAVKKVRKYLQLECKPEVAIRLFNNEVRSLSLLRHNNIVPILGFSIDGPAPCIVCRYIDGGSLEEKIAAKVLTESQRMNIILGTAEGLRYIHNTEKPLLSGSTETESHRSTKRTYFLHGDVKSANILLTKDCVPKLCDFGLAKQYNSTFVTRSMMGTSAYMAPEGFSGTITQKNDIFSFGIVMLELITGLRSIIIDSNENINIKNFIEENCTDDDINKFVDPVIGQWSKAQKLYNLAKHCLEPVRNSRPTIDKICDLLIHINSR